MNSSFHYRRKDWPNLPSFLSFLFHASFPFFVTREIEVVKTGVKRKLVTGSIRVNGRGHAKVGSRENAQLNLESRLRQSDAFNQSTQIRNYESDGGFASRWNTNRPTNHGPIVQFLTLLPRFDNLSLTTSERFHEIQPAMKRFIWIYIGF